MSKFRTPDELREFRQEQAKRAGDVSRSNAKRRKAATACGHEDRDAVPGKKVCLECYVSGDASTSLALKDAVALAEKYGDPAEVKAIKERVLALLFERLPEYASVHFEGAKMAALKGDTRPAEWALTHIRRPGDTAVLEPPKKESEGGSSGPRVIIGVQLGGITDGGHSSKPVNALVTVDEPTG